ncbi:MAG: acyltransferase family protein, partial [Clostridium sp.]|nr:acyltransferase family protein [Clostridium sp.]
VNPHYLILFLYMFHMPLFTFISGYFCKKSRRTTQEKVLDTTKIYLIAQTFYFFFNKFVLGQRVKFQLFYPSWTLWYLLALIAWYIISDYIKNYRKAMAISIILSLLIGFEGSIGSYASISRIFFFMPFFIAGMAFNKEVFLEKYKKYSIHFGIAVSLIMVILFLVREVTDVELLFEYSDYTFYLESAVYPFIVRAFHYIGGFTICYFMLLTFTNKKTIFTWLGQNSLPLYVCHAAVIQLIVKVPYHILRYNNWIQLVVSESIILISIIIVSFICGKIKNYIKSLKRHSVIEITESM